MADSSNYYFRDDLEAEKQRKAEGLNAPATLAPPANAPTTQAAPAQDNTFGNLAKAANAVKPPEQKPDYFADFRSALDAQDPFKQQAQKAVSETFANPTAAFDAAASAQTDKLAREQAAQQEQQRQQAVLAFGGNQTGQVGKSMRAFDNQAIMQQASLGRDITAGRAQAAETARGNAVNQSLALLGENRAGAAQAAGLGLQQESQRSQEALARKAQGLDEAKFQAADANAKKGLSLEESAQALQKMGMTAEDARFYAGLASQENVSFAQLSQQDKALAQEAMLAGNRLDWDKQALKLGLDDKAADRIWQAAEGEKQRATQEKVAFAQIGSQEKIQASQLAFEGAQNELNRSLEKLLSNDKIAAQFQLADMDQKFQDTMQTKGFVQEKDLETMRSDLQKTLQARGIDADTAKQVADQKFTEMMASKDQAFQVQMNDVKQKFITGERIDTQTWDKTMQAGEMQHEELLAKLNSTLRLDEAKNAQAFQTSFQNMQNDFSSLMQDRGFTHEQAMQTATQNFQKSMEQAGYTHEEAMQATQLAAQASENQMNRASQEMMATAQLAQQDNEFSQELEQKYQFNKDDLELRKKDLEANLSLMGLQGDQLSAAIQNEKVKSAMDIAALGMEIGNGSPESMAPFVEQFGAALSGYMKEQGIDISKSDFVKAMTTKDVGSTGIPLARSETGGFAPGTKVAGVDINKVTREDWKSLSADPAKLSSFVKAGVVKEVDSLGKITTYPDALKTIQAAGLGDLIANDNGTKITFKPQTYVYYNGKPYQLTSYNTQREGTGRWSDDSTNGYLRGIDLATGKETVLKHDRRG